jgi:hypothetical protein
MPTGLEKLLSNGTNIISAIEKYKDELIDKSGVQSAVLDKKISDFKKLLEDGFAINRAGQKVSGEYHNQTDVKLQTLTSLVKISDFNRNSIRLHYTYAGKSFDKYNLKDPKTLTEMWEVSNQLLQSIRDNKTEYLEITKYNESALDSRLSEWEKLLKESESEVKRHKDIQLEYGSIASARRKITANLNKSINDFTKDIKRYFEKSEWTRFGISKASHKSSIPIKG